MAARSLPRLLAAAALPLAVAGTVAGSLTLSSSSASAEGHGSALTSPSAPQPGEVGALGDAATLDASGQTPPADAVTIARTPSGHGYWIADANGGVFSYGDATFYGSLATEHLRRPIVGMAGTPDGRGYWLVASDGGIFSFGDAGFYGSTGSENLNRPIVGMAATPSGHGYWLVASDGGIFTFGDAAFYGSTGGESLNQPIVGIAATPRGQGYWLAAADGGIFSFGDAPFKGSMPGHGIVTQGVTSIASAPQGNGYWLAQRDGSIFAFGDAPYVGAVRSEPSGAAVVALAASTDGHGYWELTGPDSSASLSAASISSGTPLGNFVITCYDLRGTTASGAPAGPGVVAVDPGVIPLGSHIAIDGMGQWTALDTGGAIRGRRLDIWEPSSGACASWGVQARAVTLVS